MRNVKQPSLTPFSAPADRGVCQYSTRDPLGLSQANNQDKTRLDNEIRRTEVQTSLVILRIALQSLSKKEFRQPLLDRLDRSSYDIRCTHRS